MAKSILRNILCNATPRKRHIQIVKLKSTHCYKEIEYSKKIKLLNMTSMKYDTRENHLVADDVLLTKMRMKLLE